MSLKLCLCFFKISSTHSRKQPHTHGNKIPLLVNINFRCYIKLQGVKIKFFWWQNFCGFCCHKATPQQDMASEVKFLHLYMLLFDFFFSFVSALRVFSLKMYHSHNGEKPHVIMWGVSTNIHAAHKRVAGNAVMNMS